MRGTVTAAGPMCVAQRVPAATWALSTHSGGPRPPPTMLLEIIW